MGLRTIDDAAVAAIVSRRALVEIRFLAGNRPSWDRASKQNLDRIRFLADMCHNMPGIARPQRIRWRRGRRPMSWTWNTTAPEGQALMLQWIEEAGCRWVPPPPIEATKGKGDRKRTGRFRIGARRP